MKKTFFLSFMFLLVALACFVAWSINDVRKRPVSQLTLPDGTVVRVVATTYGKAASSSISALLLAPFPGDIQQKISRWSNYHIFSVSSMNTGGSNDLNVFTERRTNAASKLIGGYYTAFLGDDSNFVSGAECDISMWYALSETLGPIHFPVFPRRSRQITMHIFYHGSTGQVTNCGSFTFDNPKFQTYPAWQPETLPATKQTNDLEATLLDLRTGFDSSSSARALPGGRMIVTHGTNRLDGRNETAVSLKLRPLVNSGEVWQAAGVEVSDATGNHAVNSGMSWTGSTADFTFTPGLWPSEAAWKIKLLLKKQSGFQPNELIVFKNVPLGEVDKTNYLGWSSNLSGITVTLDKFNRHPPITGSSWSTTTTSAAVLTTSPLPPGTCFDLVDVVFDTGKTNQSDGSSASDTVHTYMLRAVPEAATTADFTFALQKSRAVEFTAKPELPTPDDVLKEDSHPGTIPSPALPPRKL